MMVLFSKTTAKQTHCLQPLLPYFIQRKYYRNEIFAGFLGAKISTTTQLITLHIYIPRFIFTLFHLIKNVQFQT